MNYSNIMLMFVLCVLIYIIIYVLFKTFTTKKDEGFNSYLDNPDNNPNVRGVTITDIKSDGFSIKFHAPKGFSFDGNKYIVNTSDYVGRTTQYKFNLEVQNFLVVVGIYSDRLGKNLLRTNTYNIYPNECKSSGPYDIVEYNEEICNRNIILSDLDKLKDDIKTTDEEPTLYIKVGVMTIYKLDNNSLFKDLYGMPVLPNNPSIRANGGLFPLKQLNINLDDSDYNEFQKFKRQQQLERELEDTGDTDACISTDGKMEFIKANLGGYPDNLFLKERTGDKSLGDLIKRQLSLGILNVNIHTQDM